MLGGRICASESVGDSVIFQNESQFIKFTSGGGVRLLSLKQVAQMKRSIKNTVSVMAF